MHARNDLTSPTAPINHGRFTRRAFVVRGGMAGLGISAFSVLLAACGESANTPASSGSATNAPAQAPAATSPAGAANAPASSGSATGTSSQAKPSGEPQKLVIGFQYDAASLDPAVINGPIESDTGYQIYSSLLRLPSGTTTDFKPDLAEKWSISSDGKVYTFNLRHGVQWHKGYGEVTAEDVKYSFDRLRDKNTGSAYLSQMNSVEDIVAVDNYTVEIHLVAPWPNFFLEFLQYRPGFIVNKKAIEEGGKNYSENAIGSGAYMLESFTTRNGITLKVNDSYYGKRPFFDSLRYEMILQEEVLGIAVENGDVDLMFGQNPTVELSLLSSQKITTQKFPSQRIYYMAVNTDRTPTNDVRVRQALWWAIDKDQLVKAAFEGLGVPLDTLLNPTIAESQWKNRPYKYDPDQAKKLLNEAGFDFNTTLLMPTESNDPIPPVIQAQLAKIGVKTDTPSMERLTLFDTLKKGEYHLGVSALLRFSGDQIYSQLLAKANIGGSNWARFSNDELEDLLLKARQELDEAKRLQYWARLQAIVQEQVPYIPLFAPEWVLATQSNIVGAAPGPLRVYSDEISRKTGR